MRFEDILSGAGVSALLEATEIAKDELKDNFDSASVTKLTKNGFWMKMTDKEGNEYKRIVKHKGKATIIS